MDITFDTLCRCFIPLCDKGSYSTFEVGTDIDAGDEFSYKYLAADGGYCAIYDCDGFITKEFNEVQDAYSQCTAGGGFKVTSDYSKIVVGPTVAAYKTCYRTVRDIVSSASNLDDLNNTIDSLSIDKGNAQDIINLYFEYNRGTPGGTSVPLSVVDGKLCITYIT